MHELRQIARLLRRSPGFTLAACGVLALTIGSAAAMFSFVDAILLRPLPYIDPNRVVMLWETRKGAPPRSSTSAVWFDPRQTPVSAANLLDWSREQRVFDRMEAVDFHWFSFPDTEVLGGQAGTGFFEMLGAKAALGRTFGPGDQGQPVVVLTDASWRSHFGADPSLIGRSITTTDNERYTVIGVLQPNFFFYLNDFQLWVPHELTPQQRRNRGGRRLLVAARLKSGVSLSEAQAAMDSIAGALAQTHPDTNRDWGISIVPVRKQFTSFLGPIVLALFAAVAILLLIGSVNVAGLCLARMETRKKEIAIRRALGATPWRIMRTFWAEALLLTLPSAAAGLLLAKAALPQMVALLPVKLPIPIPGIESITIGARVAMFTVVLSILTAILIGVLPALRSSTPDLNRDLTDSGAVCRNRFFSALVVAQTAFAILLLAGAGVAAKSLWRLFKVDQGFEREGVLTFRIPLHGHRPQAEDWVQAHARFLAEIERLPGVTSASLAYGTPLGGEVGQTTFLIEGQTPPSPAQTPRAGVNAIGPNYFRTLRIPLRSGRDFSAGDTQHSQPVAIISESVARKYWPGRDPVGQRIRFSATPLTGGQTARPSAPRTIIAGVVGDVRAWANAPPSMMIYRPYQQDPYGAMGYVVRTAGRPLAFGSAVERVIRGIDKEQPITFLRLLDDDFVDQIYPQRVTSIGLVTFAGMALLLAAAGVFSTTMYSVRQRTREFGIRLALGAQPHAILLGVVWQSIRIAAVGCCLGLGAALALNRLLGSILFEVEAADPAALGIVVAILGAVALAACWLPAREATRVDPVKALRSQ
jgi:putative ABC transport system permease protein